MSADRWRRRARPLLGTLVEIATPGCGDEEAADAAIDAAFGLLAELQAALSAFDPASDVGRFNAAPSGAAIVLRPATREVLAAALSLQQATGGAFDVSLGSGPGGWRLDGERLHKDAAGTRLDLGGIAKGYAVDQAVGALQRAGRAAGWVNAGGDLRVFGDVELPVVLRGEAGDGGVRPFARLADGALATSRYAPGSRCRLAGGRATAHVSVAAPCCLWADALTKVVALDLDAAPALLARHGAQAWRH